MSDFELETCEALTLGHAEVPPFPRHVCTYVCALDNVVSKRRFMHVCTYAQTWSPNANVRFCRGS
eukprot:241276-Ditylum_brightwellii.AAC.1